ncbi:snRNA-activating protein complex subunit [Apis cerana cerana]|uniref:snRNA-activating protein complex subunit n=1 Tax=Apis cerana cerana TaxID=94128 RepID=A0A2A3EGA2_APICC|nr:snRNA-activating protein complex subunit [Apis cerana cerana]
MSSNEDNDDNDLVKILLLEKVSIKNQRSILEKKYETEDDFMEYNIENYNNTLHFNRQIVSSLLDLKKHVTFALQKCERKLKAIEKNLQKHALGDTKILICNAGMPYFKDKYYFFAPNNEDEILKENSKELQLRNLPKVSSWTKKEREMLLKAIQKEAISDVLCIQKIECSKLNNKMFKLKTKNDDKKEVKTEFLPKNFLEMIKSKRLQEKEFDWFKISSTYFEDIHSPLDCSVMWNVFLQPDINKSHWTKSEDIKLRKIVKKYKFQNWDKIAKELNTNRTAYQCFIRYNTTKKLPKIRNCTWENEEDERLLKLIEIFKVGDFIPWGDVASWMQNRTKQQAYFRWTYSLTPYLIKGRFTKIEDNILKDAVIKYGTNFRKISAALMPNRSTVQLHDRYQTLTINQIENWNLWTFEEDTKLLNLFENIGPNWSMIAKQFSSKNRTQLRHRYKALQKYIKRGVSLFELHKHHFYEENEKEKEQKKEDSFKDIFKSNNIDSNDYDNDLDKKLIEYFHTRHKIEKLIHKCKFHNMEKLQYNTTNLYNILQILNAKLYIPNDISDIKLNDRDQELLYSLRDFIKLKNDKKKYFETINKYISRMFGMDETKDSHFVPPPPFDSQIKLKKSKKSQCIDYNLNAKNNFLLEKPTSFNTPDIVISYIGGNEEELQFQKLSRLFEINNSRYEQIFKTQNCSKFPAKMLLQEHTNNDSDKKNSTNDRLLEKVESITLFDIGTETHDIEKHDIPMIYASHATLSSFKNLMYLKRLNEKYNSETRLEQLFKYPIGLSKIVLPEVYVMDTFLYNDITPKRKISKISYTLDKHKTKKLRMLSENNKKIR